MKNILFLFAFALSVSLNAQARKPGKMAPIYSEGYYLNNKGDTVRGKVQINPGDETSFYKQFNFVGGRAKKGKLMTAQTAKAYGYDGRDFVVIAYNGEKLFLERLVNGRLRFYEYKFHGKKNGYPAIEADYFIKDCAAEGADLALRTPRRISSRFYKKALKPYLKDQPMLWDDLDKYTFDKAQTLKTIKEFNGFYMPTAN